MKKTEEKNSVDKAIENSINIRKNKKIISKNINRHLGRTKDKKRRKYNNDNKNQENFNINNENAK